MPLSGSNQSKKQGPMAQGHADDFQTPPEALYPLFGFIKKGWTIWECATGKGNLERELSRRGYKVVGTDILMGKDFLRWRPEQFDCVITNPPYSLKQEFLERCYELEKPFALLLPLTTFETPKRQGLFREHGVQIVFFDRRINFTTPSGKGSGAWFAVAWFTWGLCLPNDIMFVRYKNPAQTELTFTDVVEK